MKQIKLLLGAATLLTLVLISSAFNKQTEKRHIIEDKVISEDENAMEALIIWVKGTKEEDKQEYRDYYKDMDIMLSWYVCEDDDKETWLINCDNPEYSCAEAKEDPPVKEKKPKTCCMQKVMYNLNCEK